MTQFVAPRRRGTPPGAPQPSRRPKRGGRLGRGGLLTALGLVPVLAVVAVLALQVRETVQPPAVGDGPCGLEDSGRAVFLLDLRKPLADRHAELPVRLLRDVTRELAANTELSVYALADYAEAPRMLLGRLCKSYDSADLALDTAKDQPAPLRGCDDLPAQIPPAMRDGAMRFCAEREALAGRLRTLAGTRPGGPVANSYLVEAFEDTARDFERHAGPRTLYVFSDMMQHAEWFSHLDVAWSAWDFDRFDALRAGRALAGEAVGMGAGVKAVVFYLARKDVTELPRQREAHRRFWEAYFADAQLAFLPQAAVLDYAGERLMDVPTEAELVARERERMRYERTELERMRAELERSERALAEEREGVAEDRERWRRRESELRREQERVREREAELARERDRLAVRNVGRPVLGDGGIVVGDAGGS